MDQSTVGQEQFGEFNDPSAPAYNPDEKCGGGSSSSGGNAKCQEDWILNGYGGQVGIKIPTLNEDSKDTGLAGNSGLADSAREKVSTLVDKVIQLPVATAFSGKQRLTTVGVVSVRVCATMIGKGAGALTEVTSGECDLSKLTPQPNTPSKYCEARNARLASLIPPQPPDCSWDDLKNNEAGLWVIPTDMTTSSGTTGPTSGCFKDSVPQECTFNARAVTLFR